MKTIQTSQEWGKQIDAEIRDEEKNRIVQIMAKTLKYRIIPLGNQKRTDKYAMRGKAEAREQTTLEDQKRVREDVSTHCMQPVHYERRREQLFIGRNERKNESNRIKKKPL